MYEYSIKTQDWEVDAVVLWETRKEAMGLDSEDYDEFRLIYEWFKPGSHKSLQKLEYLLTLNLANLGLRHMRFIGL